MENQILTDEQVKAINESAKRFHETLQEIGKAFLEGFVNGLQGLQGSFIDWEKEARKYQRRAKYLRRYERIGRLKRKK